MGDSPSSDSGSNNESRMSPGRATAQFGAEVGSLAGGYTESQVQDAIDQNESSDSPRTNVEIARDARVPGTFTQQSQNYVDDFSGANRGSLPTSRGTSTASYTSKATKRKQTRARSRAMFLVPYRVPSLLETVGVHILQPTVVPAINGTLMTGNLLSDLSYSTNGSRPLTMPSKRTGLPEDP